MTTFLTRLAGGFYGKDKAWHPAVAFATSDGFTVSCHGNGPGWACNCGDPECAHPDNVAKLISPAILQQLEADDDTPFRKLRPRRRGTGPVAPATTAEEAIA